MRTGIERRVRYTSLTLPGSRRWTKLRGTSRILEVDSIGNNLTRRIVACRSICDVDRPGFRCCSHPPACATERHQPQEGFDRKRKRRSKEAVAPTYPYGSFGEETRSFRGCRRRQGRADREDRD